MKPNRDGLAADKLAVIVICLAMLLAGCWWVCARGRQHRAEPRRRFLQSVEHRQWARQPVGHEFSLQAAVTLRTALGRCAPDRMVSSLPASGRARRGRAGQLTIRNLRCQGCNFAKSPWLRAQPDARPQPR